MLARFISNVLNLNVEWIAIDLLLTFIVMTFILYTYHIIESKNRKGILGFVLIMFVLWGVLDIISLLGLTLFTHNYMLEFFIFQFAFVYLIFRTRFEKYQLPVMVLVFVIMSWVVT